MSAIYGFVQWGCRRDTDAQAGLDRLGAAHRGYGPDAAGTHTEETARHRIGMGCELFMLKEGRDRRAVFREDGLTAVFDALLFNREELIDALIAQGESEVQLKGANDSHLMFRAYLAWGEELVDHVIGDFTGSIWDEERKKLTLFRDHLGVRPLYYAADASGVVWATDIRAFTAFPGMDLSLNEDLLYRLLENLNTLEAKETYFAAIHKTPIAHFVTVSFQGAVEGGVPRVTARQYWTPGACGKVLYDTDAEYMQRMDEMVRDAVARRLDATDRLVGVELSGGLDSSLIAVLTHRHGGEAHYFSWSPSPEDFPLQEKDERKLIRQVCDQEGITCQFAGRDMEAVWAEMHAQIEEAEPPDQGTTPSMREGMKAFQARGARMVLSGMGGDEGVSHRASYMQMLWYKEYGDYLREVVHLSRGNPLRFIKNGLLSPIKAYRENKKGWEAPRETDSVASAAFLGRMKGKVHNPALTFRTDLADHFQAGSVQLRAEVCAWLGAKYHLQYVFPYMDYRLVDFAVSLPRRMFYYRGVSRYLYRKTFENLLPKEVCEYTHKDDFGITASIRSQRDTLWARQRAEIVDRLSPVFWSRYLDFERLEALRQGSGSEERDEMNSIFVSTQIVLCLNIQQLAEEKGGDVGRS